MAHAVGNGSRHDQFMGFYSEIIRTESHILQGDTDTMSSFPQISSRGEETASRGLTLKRTGSAAYAIESPTLTGSSPLSWRILFAISRKSRSASATGFHSPLGLAWSRFLPLGCGRASRLRRAWRDISRRVVGQIGSVIADICGCEGVACAVRRRDLPT